LCTIFSHRDNSHEHPCPVFDPQRDRLEYALGEPTMQGWIKVRLRPHASAPLASCWHAAHTRMSTQPVVVPTGRVLMATCALPRPSRVRLHWSALQIRSRLKIWHKFWAVIYPGKLVLYEDENQTSWKGTLILSNMQARQLLTCPLSSTSAACALHSSPLLHVSLTSLVVYQHSYHHPRPNRPSFAHCDACYHCAHLNVRRRSTPVLRPTRQHGVRHATSPPTHVQVQERPTKKAGFSWKCTTEFGQDIFARKGVSAFHNHSCINEPPEFNNSNSRQNLGT